MANDWNQQIIAEFRANAGKVGGPFEGKDLLLLTTTGAKTGLPRTNPTAYIRDGNRFVIIASKGGAPENPAWYHNLLADPRVTLEVGTETIEATATPITGGPERDRLFAVMVAAMPGFAEYQTKTDRVIPVVALTPSSGESSS
ncbi:nitroreductase family deazaflavin-dependent oxidoreductase [Nocardia sp. NPDC049707]|uniref:nitroreductase family deazaflavin-dependent oxidoreductase n=1 Tax=Nocardia sp. NPDC049707 TaxID=3154735 RepID=UPI0034219E6B